MNYDWNSFFGTLSQSSGGLLGILAAFFISRLISLQDKLLSLHDRRTTIYADISKVRDRLSNRYFRWMNERTLDSDELKKSIANGDFDSMSREEIIVKLYSEFKLYRDDFQIWEEYEVLYKKYSRAKSVLPILSLPSNQNGYLDKREMINSCIIDAKSVINQLRGLAEEYAKLSGGLGAVQLFSYFILIVFPLFVVYPLHFLPIPSNVDPNVSFRLTDMVIFWLSLRGLFLFLFLAAFEGGFFYLLYIIAKQHKEATIWQREMSNVGVDGIGSLNNYLRAIPLSVEQVDKGA